MLQDAGHHRQSHQKSHNAPESQLSGKSSMDPVMQAVGLSHRASAQQVYVSVHESIREESNMTPEKEPYTDDEVEKQNGRAEDIVSLQ